MERYRVKAKFDQGRIVCISQIFSTDCCEKDKYEDIDLYIDSKYEGVKD
ncbi:hypothetical protein [Clostridium formicaceticum]|nr:hypothetical protein [Clostridium formicaceticum]